MRTCDVVVIGSGMAGTAAALAAAARGAAVTVIESTPGATALSNGCWMGPLPASVSTALSAVEYDVVSAERPLPAPDGSLVESPFAGQSHVLPQTDRVLICAIAGLAGFHARVLARMWERLGGELIAHEIMLRDTPAAGWSPVGLVSVVQEDLTRLSALLHGLVREHRATHVILPAILGIDRHQTIRATLQHILGATVSEALGTVPSIPGARLQHALSKALLRANVKVVRARVIDRTSDNSELRTVQLSTGEALGAKRFVLATGKFVGGGIEAESAFAEPALGCPVWLDYLGERFENVEPLTQTDADRHDEQPLMTTGVATDRQGRPHSAFAELVYSNVWVAGSVRAGASASLGRAAEEGWSAGERAAS